nr:hypothetical protein [Tanacetum cinerariifolium]
MGWDTNVVDIHVLFSSWQVMLCLVEIVQEKTKFLCSFVYAANNGKDRVELWKDLALQNSVITQDMQDFKDCVSNNELEDICSSGFQYTWNKSPKNPKGGILKKLDRAIINEKFITKYELAHEKLKETQAKIDRDPFNSKIREEVAVILQDYKEAMDDEYKLLSQKAKIQWLKEGDKNNAYFHKVVKGRKHRSRIESICDENKIRYFGDEVPRQIVKHFQNFLGVERLVQPMDEDDLMFIKKLDVVEASNMINDITDKEIQEAMFDIDNHKAPGPDGKVLTNRIKSGLEKVVSINQSAFIPGRNIHDNILLTQELLKGYNRKNGPKRCALKIDLQKAYDTVSWSFLKTILERFGFHDVMINWIMTCISTSAFSINVNGQSHGYFKGAKDDLMVFCNGDVHSIIVVKKSLNEFGRVSGLFPNLKKSTIFFGSVNGQVKQEILKIVDFSIGKLPMRYLGIPLFVKCLSVNDCRQLIDKVKEMIVDWKNRFLSYAGRLQLISFVLASIQTYWASVYLIPKTVVKKIDKVMKNFLLSHGGSNDKMKRHVIYKIGNGLNTWFDKWDHNGPLSNFITKRDIYDARFKSNNSVAKLIEEDRWKWPSEWLDMFPILKKIQVPSLNDSSDKVAWISKTRQHKIFSVKEAWKSVRTNYSKKVWGNIKAMINLDQVTNEWKDIIEHLQSLNKHKNIRSILKKIGVAACVYMIWNERNSRTFSKGSREEETLTKIVKDEIRWKLASLNVKRTVAVKKVFDEWGMNPSYCQDH